MSSEKMIVALGADHGGYLLKESLKSFLSEKGYAVIDCGTTSNEAVDYPKFAFAVAKQVAEKNAQFGIMIDGAGIGSAMTANKVKGIRAAACYDISTANNAREHNNANMLTLGAGLTGEALVKQIVMTFLTTECTAERHLKRVAMIDELDKGTIDKALFKPIATTGKEEKLADISNEDLLKIAQRVSELITNKNNSVTPGPNHQDSDMVCMCGVTVDRKPETIRQFLDFGVQRLGYHEGTGCDCVPGDIAQCIDHTVLSPGATEEDIKRICAEAREYNFATVCISPSYVSLAAKELEASPVKVCTVVGFPSGAHTPEIKALEARRAIRDGAREIDMVINIGALKSGNDDLVYKDIRMVCEACEDGGAISKVIIEAALLTDDEKVRACELSKKARANFVKTSTGFGPHGATAEDVALMRKVVGYSGIGVKAAGGIRSYEDAEKMIKAGANRIGASASIKIVGGATPTTVSN
ncbi:MAG: deoxyribose-phosphate aldolase [Candidatus Marinimicrobia bacterium]|nr:deoxyribose-phosphate aldolase [Candidatus Neomarinimicrobiota bacterium]